MKKLLAILLILCLCLGALAACDEPSSGPSGIPPQGGETPDGETPGGETPGGETPGGGNTNPGGGNTNPDGGNTNPDGGNTNPDGGNTNPDGGNTNPDGGNTNPPAPDSDARTTVTEEEFAAAVEGNFPNYTSLSEIYFSNGGKHPGYSKLYMSEENGRPVFLRDELNNAGEKWSSCGFFLNGTYWCGSYSAETGKWNLSSNGSYSIGYPTEGMPYSLSDFTYDEAKGEYYLQMEGVDKMLTAEQIAAGYGNITLRFENGKLVKLGIPRNVTEAEGVWYMVTTLGNYGTTVVPTPPMEDIVFNNNATNTSPDHNDDANSDVPPPSHDKDDNNNDDEGKDHSSTNDKTVSVWISHKGREYHKDPSCTGEDLKEMFLQDAEHEGYYPCKRCC